MLRRVWTAIGGFAGALGPVVGGFLVTWSWRWIFLVNVPIGLFALAIGSWKLPVVPVHTVRRPGNWGALLVTLGVGMLTYSIMKSPEWGLASGRLPGVDEADDRAQPLGCGVGVELAIEHEVRLRFEDRREPGLDMPAGRDPRAVS